MVLITFPNISYGNSPPTRPYYDELSWFVSISGSAWIATCEVKVSQSCVTLCDPMDCTLPSFSVHVFLQARILEWVVIPFSGGIFPTQRLNPCLPHCRQSLYCLSHQKRLNFPSFNIRPSVRCRIKFRGEESSPVLNLNITFKNPQKEDLQLWHLASILHTLQLWFRSSLVAQAVKNLPAIREAVFDPWVRKIPWRRQWLPTPVFLSGKFHQQRSLVGYILRGTEESDMTEQLTPPLFNHGTRFQ